jgi:hypothetical protein
MKYFPCISPYLASAAMVLALATAGSGCNPSTATTTPSDSLKNATVESFHHYFDHHGNLDESKAFFSPSLLKGHKVATAKFFDHFAGKPEFAKDLPDEIKHFDTEGRMTKEEFLAIDGEKHAYGTETWSYDSTGHVTGFSIAYPWTGKVTSVKYNYDADGRLMGIDTKAYESVAPDSALHFTLLHEITYGGKGNIPSQITRKKDTQEVGKVATQWVGDTLMYTYHGDEDMEVRFLFHADGTVKEMIEKDILPSPFHKKHTYSYDAKNRPNSKDEHYLDNGKYALVNTTQWTYDEKGLLTGEDVYMVKGEEKKLIDKDVVEYTFHE